VVKFIRGLELEPLQYIEALEGVVVLQIEEGAMLVILKKGCVAYLLKNSAPEDSVWELVV
jgi:hypothetical protein